MIIEGHFAGTRAKHYTDRDVEELRDVYRRAYSFIRLCVNDLVQVKTENETIGRFSTIEAQLERHPDTRGEANNSGKRIATIERTTQKDREHRTSAI